MGAQGARPVRRAVGHGAPMTTIKRDALHAFIDRQLFRVESTPVPPELREVEEREGLSADQVQALWLGAGIASQIGMALALDPSAFVEPWPGHDDADQMEAA